MALWEAGKDVVAWGWLKLPADPALVLDPAHPALVEEVLEWASGAA